LVRDLNRLYRATPALHRRDSESAGFRWVVIDDAGQSVFAYLRFGTDADPPALVVCNFTPVPRYQYRIGVPQGGYWREMLNTDSALYGGSNVGNGGGCHTDAEGSHGMPTSLRLTLPPLATLVLQPG
jgi:1,4-alpha-glucan branching enzyme